MSRRAARRQRSRERQIRESGPARRRQLVTRLSLAAGLVAVVLGVVVGGILYAGSRSSGPAQIVSSATGLEVGSDVGNQVPGFDLRLVDGSTVNSADLVGAGKPAFYFFFATW